MYQTRSLPPVLLSLLLAAELSAQTITTIAGIENIPREMPTQQHNPKCVDRGKEASTNRLDTVTNLLKNRVDSAQKYRLTTIPTLLKLPFKRTGIHKGDDMPRLRNGWNDAD